MDNKYVCWKSVDGIVDSEQQVLRIDGVTYAFVPASENEVEKGLTSLDEWYVERKYKTQVAGLGRVYYDMRSETQRLSFEELIFKGGECIGIYHDGLIFVFDNAETHYQQKYLGEMPTGPDQAITFYDYYYLHPTV